MQRVTVWVQRFPDRKHLVLQWHDPETGRRKSRSAKTADQKEAERLARDLEYELSHGTYAEPSKMAWADFRKRFEEEYAGGLRPATRQNFSHTFALFEDLIGPKTLRGVTERTVSAFVAAMRAKRVRGGGVGLAPGTIRVHLEFLHTALSWAKGQKLIPEVPAFPEVKVPRKRPQPVPAEAFERLLAAAPDPDMRAFLLCGWLAGLRLTEAALLERHPTDSAPYVDWGRARIVLPAELVKGAEDQWVPLDPELREALEALPDRGPRLMRFVDRRTGRPIRPHSLCDRVHEMAKAAGVKLSMKSLRRGFACRYAASVPAQVLQRLMRHSNINITTQYYANVDEAVEAAVLGDRRNSSRNTPPAPGPFPGRVAAGEGDASV